MITIEQMEYRKSNPFRRKVIFNDIRHDRVESYVIYDDTSVDRYFHITSERNGKRIIEESVYDPINRRQYIRIKEIGFSDPIQDCLKEIIQATLPHRLPFKIPRTISELVRTKLIITKLINEKYYNNSEDKFDYTLKSKQRVQEIEHTYNRLKNWFIIKSNKINQRRRKQ